MVIMVRSWDNWKSLAEFILYDWENADPLTDLDNASDTDSRTGSGDII